MQEVFEKIIEKLEERTSFLSDCTKYGNKDAEQQKKSYSTMMMYEVADLVDDLIEIVKQEAEQYNNGWVPCSDRLPEDCDNRFYMCIVENHEEDLPMFCQYDEEYGFGFWHDIYDEHTLGFVDSEFKTNEELGYEKVIAWQQLLPYQPKGE